jgi:hypothetical protein
LYTFDRPASVAVIGWFDNTSYEFTFDDWGYLIDETHAVNRASMRKFGIEVGQVTLFFTKPGT